MEAILEAPLAPSKTRRVAAIALAALPVAFLTFDAAMKIALVAPVVTASERIGWPIDTLRPLGLVLLACVALYVAPRTSVLGAVLLTGWLGGAVATHVRLGDPLFSHVLAPVYVAIMLWGSLRLRDERVRRAL